MIHAIFSSLPSFKNLKNLKPGLNVLLAQKSSGATSKQTRNRAGKSSLIEHIHFLLGARVEKNSIFLTDGLEAHDFGITFDLMAKTTTVTRCGRTKEQVQVLPSAENCLTNAEWSAFLGEAMFGLSSLEASGANPPSFRSLFAYFARRQASGAFATPEKQATMQGTGDMQAALMFLLGLDWRIAQDWQAVRDREKTLKELKKVAGNGGFGPYLGKVADLRTKMTVQGNRLKKLREEVAAFKVLPEYRELETECDNLTRQLNELANANTLDLAAIHDLKAALDTEVSPRHDDLESVYREAGVILPGLVKHRYEEVLRFHESVVRNRKDYLASELEAALSRIEVRNKKKALLDQRRSEVLGILKSHGALDQFLRLQEELGRLTSEVTSLQIRLEAALQLEDKKNEMKVERNSLMLRLQRDFSEQEDRSNEAILAFEETSQRLYESAGSMNLDVTANGPKFEFPMQGERSKGIQNMQIFCFDIMLMRLCAKRNIGPGFLIHDSHLFDGVDGRQVISALRIGAETATELGFQYIVTLNEDDAFKETLPGFELRDYLLPVRLTDATDDGGLFGIRF